MWLQFGIRGVWLQEGTKECGSKWESQGDKEEVKRGMVTLEERGVAARRKQKGCGQNYESGRLVSYDVLNTTYIMASVAGNTLFCFFSNCSCHAGYLHDLPAPSHQCSPESHRKSPYVTTATPTQLSPEGWGDAVEDIMKCGGWAMCGALIRNLLAPFQMKTALYQRRGARVFWLAYPLHGVQVCEHNQWGRINHQVSDWRLHKYTRPRSQGGLMISLLPRLNTGLPWFQELLKRSSQFKRHFVFIPGLTKLCVDNQKRIFIDCIILGYVYGEYSAVSIIMWGHQTFHCG